jgi:hypothetical protein
MSVLKRAALLSQSTGLDARRAGRTALDGDEVLAHQPGKLMTALASVLISYLAWIFMVTLARPPSSSMSSTRPISTPAI